MKEDLTALSDEELERALGVLVKDERLHLVAILRRLAEFDRRDLALKRGFPSLFDYCREKFRYSEPEAARRIQVARAAAKFAVLYRLLERGRLSLTVVSMLAPHLSRESYSGLIRRAVGKSKREVEALLASLSPRREPVELIRHLGSGSSAAGAGAAPGPGEAELFRPGDSSGAASPSQTDAGPQRGEMALSPPREAGREWPAAARVHFSFVADGDLLRDVERAKELLRHKYPAARLGEVFAEAVGALLERIDPERRELRRKARRSAAGRRPAAGGDVRGEPAARSRRIPEGVKAEVWRRDGGSCAFVAPDGRRCGARARLQFDHRRAWAKGGRSDEARNIEVLCRAHNLLKARREFGAARAGPFSARREHGARGF